MSRAAVIGGLALLGVLVSRAEPVVTGYERFHAAQPGAAGGRLLYNELGCANCHGGETGLPARRGADLNTVTTRARAEWLQAFIADPTRVHMPASATTSNGVASGVSRPYRNRTAKLV